eukprot:gnl/TRDRNA2_/TRDRNA2_177299_c0_seq1.p1 gnl/TRDRNA2_/TRDRNA2_177299_c0~~gnl/TRDRNA2_/TRDRNA2_177299_c0_seq1.p1  ORF type:complete len:406 (+),score=27.81 gnl/TRDRNA2_/TRDRNA2_177299_c0_seq1:61-1278(+)
MEPPFNLDGYNVYTWDPLFPANGSWLGLRPWSPGIEGKYHDRRRWFALAAFPLHLAGTVTSFMNLKIDYPRVLRTSVTQFIAIVTMSILFWAAAFSAAYVLCRMAFRDSAQETGGSLYMSIRDNARESRGSFYMFMIFAFVLMPVIDCTLNSTPKPNEYAFPALAGVFFQRFLLNQVGTLFSLLLLITLCVLAVRMLFFHTTSAFGLSIRSLIMTTAVLILGTACFFERWRTSRSPENTLAAVPPQVHGRQQHHRYAELEDMPPEEFYQLMLVMGIPAAARDDDRAYFAARWFNQPWVRGFIDAQPPSRRAAAIRYWRDRGFAADTQDEDFTRLRGIRDAYNTRLGTRRISQQECAGLDLLRQHARLRPEVCQMILPFLQPQSDEYSTGSVTRSWRDLLQYLRCI